VTGGSGDSQLFAAPQVLAERRPKRVAVAAIDLSTSLRTRFSLINAQGRPGSKSARRGLSAKGPSGPFCAKESHRTLDHALYVAGVEHL
jgi:hypothetical protein